MFATENGFDILYIGDNVGDMSFTGNPDVYILVDGSFNLAFTADSAFSNFAGFRLEWNCSEFKII